MSEEVIILPPKRATVVVDDDRVQQLESATIRTDFEADKTTITQGESVQFTDLSSLSPTEWHWDFGDGTYSTEQHPTKTYYKPGTHTVKLVASGQGGGSDNKGNTEEKVGYVQVNGVLDGVISRVTEPRFYGCILLSRFYTGPLVRLRRMSDDEEADIFSDPEGSISPTSEADTTGDGYPDTRVVDWADSILRVVSFYDMTGQGLHCSNLPANEQGVMGLGSVSGKGGFYFVTDEGYGIPNNVAVDRASHSFTILAENINKDWLSAFCYTGANNTGYIGIRYGGIAMDRSPAILFYRPNDYRGYSTSKANAGKTVFYHQRKLNTVDLEHRVNGSLGATLSADIDSHTIQAFNGISRPANLDSQGGLAFGLALPKDQMTDQEEADLYGYLKKIYPHLP